MDLQLIQKLTILSDKLEAFLNGGPGEVIQTPLGPLMSVRGVIEEIKKTRPVQYIKDYPTTVAAGQDLLVLSEDVIRTPLGYFQKNNSGGFDKVSYSDLYDLRDIAPNPFNFDSNTFAVEQDVATVTFEPTSLKIQSTSFDIKMVARSKGVTKGIQTTTYSVHCAVKDLGSVQYSMDVVNSKIFWPREDLTVHPALSISSSNIGGKVVLAISLVSAKVGSQVQDYEYEIQLFPIDTKHVKLVKNVLGNPMNMISP